MEQEWKVWGKVPKMRRELAELRKEHLKIESDFRKKIQRQIQKEFESDLKGSMAMMKRKNGSTPKAER
jgi:hypothetical protein